MLRAFEFCREGSALSCLRHCPDRSPNLSIGSARSLRVMSAGKRSDSQKQKVENAAGSLVRLGVSFLRELCLALRP